MFHYYLQSYKNLKKTCVVYNRNYARIHKKYNKL